MHNLQIKIPHRFYIYISFLCGLIFILFAHFHYIGLIFPVDDAYIVTHNVSVIKNGVQDSNFENVPILFGTTSVIHLTLISLATVFVSPLLAQYFITCFAIMAYAVGLIKLCLNNKLSYLQTIVVSALGIIAADVPHQLLNGLETGLAMAVLVWLFVFINQDHRLRIIPILCSFLPFIRPELCVLSALVFFGYI